MTNTFIISDTHFGHTNIIKYCNRPFKNVLHMNKELIRNWNKTVNKNDVVYFLGDLTIKNSSYAHALLKILNGKIICITGNHDTGKIKSNHHRFIEYNNIKFLLIHNPKDILKNWNGWVIHGHTHNNQLSKFPFINYENKTINVSVELIHYTPINLNKIVYMVEKFK